MPSTVHHTDHVALKAHYRSPSGTKTFTYSMTSIPTEPSTTDKTDHLSSLRSSTVKLQEEINVFLTAKMDEDKTQAAADSLKVDEAKEEENYGEEVVDEE